MSERYEQARAALLNAVAAKDDHITRLESDVATLREALKAAQALATCCAAQGCYSHDELADMARATMPTFSEALSRISSGDRANG